MQEQRKMLRTFLFHKYWLSICVPILGLGGRVVNKTMKIPNSEVENSLETDLYARKLTNNMPRDDKHYEKTMPLTEKQMS